MTWIPQIQEYHHGTAATDTACGTGRRSKTFLGKRRHFDVCDDQRDLKGVMSQKEQNYTDN